MKHDYEKIENGCSMLSLLLMGIMWIIALITRNGSMVFTGMAVGIGGTILSYFVCTFLGLMELYKEEES